MDWSSDVVSSDLHLLTVEHPTAVDLAGPALDRGDGGAGLGIAHAEGDGDRAAHDLGDDLVPQEVGPDRVHDLGHHHPGGAGVDRGLDPGELVLEDVDLLRSEPREPVTGPVGRDPVAFAEGLHEVGSSEEHTSELTSLMRIAYAAF